MRSILPLVAALCVSLAAAAAESPVPLPIMAEPVKPNGWNGFSLLPKAFQRNPSLEMTVFCELTDFGRTLRSASPATPVYYIGHNGGYTSRGDYAGDHPPQANYLGGVLQHALATNGYLPATKRNPPTLVLLFHWGSHNAMDPEMRRMFRVRSRQHFQERAILVGGRRFESTIARRLAFGDFLSDHGAKTEFLTDQANDSLYFTVVSAYDVAAFQEGRRRLVWRASLTVNARGVSMADSLPALILSAAPSFGRDLREPEIVIRRVRRGVIDYGPTQVVEADVPLPAAPSPPAKSN